MNIPRHLYKYLSLSTKKDKEGQKTVREYTSRILAHNEIYFAKPSEFNDPFDKLIPEISISDFARSLNFYTRLLGFKVEYQREDPDFVRLDNRFSILHPALNPPSLRQQDNEQNSGKRA